MILMRFLLSLILIVCSASLPATAAEKKIAIFAGGCFWCMQPAFDKADGVISTVVGYTGGTKINPTYEDVSRGDTGHREAIAVRYDPEKISYEQLLNIFWHVIDPVDDSGQFCDKGQQYTSAIFYTDDGERQLAEESKMLLEADDERIQGKPITVAILKAGPFYPAETYHQSYYKKNPLRYRVYRSRCGRDQRLNDVWGDQAAGH